MYYLNIIQNSLDYLEDNLKAEIGIAELADMAGYSLHHYERVFKKLVGVSVSRYIRLRRLLHAAFEIAGGSRIVDAAYDYGFDTNAGFYKAFLREFGLPPSEYTAKYTVKRPYRIKLIQEEHIMITREKIKEMLVYWGLGSESVEYLHDENSGQRVDNAWQIGESFVMQSGTNVVGLKNHIAVSKRLQSCGFSVALPVQTTSGEDYVTQGELCYFISRRVIGDTLNDRLLFAESGTDIAYTLGQAIGRLDSTLSEFDFVCNEPFAGKPENFV